MRPRDVVEGIVLAKVSMGKGQQLATSVLGELEKKKKKRKENKKKAKLNVCMCNFRSSITHQNCFNAYHIKQILDFSVSNL